jgi:hypothetical protein
MSYRLVVVITVMLIMMSLAVVAAALGAAGRLVAERTPVGVVPVCVALVIGLVVSLPTRAVR